MPYDKKKHRRRSIRLPNHDYGSPGAYFVTICVHGWECLLGDAVDGQMQLSEFGQVVVPRPLSTDSTRRDSGRVG